ncbi:DUF4268 domain-containing protein [Photobacterium leiognathi]|uniref:DUF4268 domain-containing protein n=1 Tax=Photobacterium leiognathi TaxID=553611 RepID=UPI0027355B9F|nr:DUF4268 domain-containing protein [Photobacterium leiognathi]
MTVILGKITTVNVRTIWKHEAQDFTPWLYNHIQELSDALGIDLEVEDIEVPVGPYYADILAKDTGTGKYVVIENQLEKTDHDHLGKCLTYASVLDASTVIWIASNFTDEHKKALDWLNDHTSDELAFYGIKLELLKINESLPAANFNIISQPNDVVKQVTKRKDNSELSETRMTQLKFWEAFKQSLQKTGKITKLQTPRPQYWFDISLGKSGIHLSNTFNTNENVIGLRIYIGSKEVPKWLPYFEQHKTEIEKELEECLEWSPNSNAKDKVITLTKSFDLTDETKWQEPIQWLTNNTIRFHKVFGKLIRDGRLHS